VRVALDTNVLAYAEGVNGRDRKQATLRLFERLPQDAVVVPVQALGEPLPLTVQPSTNEFTMKSTTGRGLGPLNNVCVYVTWSSKVVEFPYFVGSP